MDEEGDVAAVIDDEFGAFAIGVSNGLLGAPPVFFEGFAFPRKDGDAGSGDSSGGMVLGGEDVAAGPAHGCAEVYEGLDEDRRLDGHVEGSGDADACERFFCSVFFTDGHEAWHLFLGDGDLFTAPVSEGQVADLEICGGGSFCEHGVYGIRRFVVLLVGSG